MSTRRSINYWSGIQHCRIRHEVLNSPAWRVLGYSARALYLDLRARLNSTNNGNISATLPDMKHRGWTSSATLWRALRQLDHMGFMAKTRQGGIAVMAKTCNLYRFTDLPVFEHPKQGIPAMDETHDYRRFETVKEARAAIRELAAEKKSKVQKLKLIGSETEPKTPSIGSETEHEDSPKLQKLNTGKRAQTRATAGGAGK